MFDEAFKYSDDAKFLGCVGTNAERLCVECNFVQRYAMSFKLFYLLITIVRKKG
jgi:hypothetical protein